jgi:hypothetical protein
MKNAPDPIVHKFWATDRILIRIISSLPRTPRPFLRESSLPYDRVLADLAICNTFIYSCTIQLHRIFASRDESRFKMLLAASDIVAVAQGLHKTPEIYWPTGIMVSDFFRRFGLLTQFLPRHGYRWVGEVLVRFFTAK